MPDIATSQANPVSTTIYTVLSETVNVKILGISAAITWATTQPTPLDVIVTVDDYPILFTVANPVSASLYNAFQDEGYANGALATTVRLGTRPYLLEGKKVKIEIRITWATTQPTPLTYRVKYAVLC